MSLPHSVIVFFVATALFVAETNAFISHGATVPNNRVLYEDCDRNLMNLSGTSDPTGERDDSRLNKDEGLDELTPPLLSLSRQSLLFTPYPASEKDNGPLRFWRQTKSTLPRFVTGAWKKGDGDKNPLGSFYNLVFIRMPAVIAGAVYGTNLVMGHPLIMNFGDGPFEMSPLIVVCLLWLLLL